MKKIQINIVSSTEKNAEGVFVDKPIVQQQKKINWFRVFDLNVQSSVISSSTGDTAEDKESELNINLKSNKRVSGRERTSKY